jgi:hypothetical protein
MKAEGRKDLPRRVTEHEKEPGLILFLFTLHSFLVHP